MNRYFHHIGDFNAACRHLTRQEASIYLDLIHRYYDKEAPIMLDTKLLARKLMRRGENAEDIEPVIRIVLEEFFIQTEEGWYNERCQWDLEEYWSNTSKKAKGGIASGKARRKKAKELKAKQIKASKGNKNVEQVLNKNEQVFTTDNLKPLTDNPPNSRKSFYDQDMILAKDMFSKIKKLNPNHKEPNLDSWATEINKIHRLDNRAYSEIQEVFDWANSDDFWCTNILSPSKLRKQYDTLVLRMGVVNKKKFTLKLPTDDEQLWNFAKQHDLPDPNPAENFKAYRYRLQTVLEQRNER